MTSERLEAIDGANWEKFLGAPWAVLMLGKSDCEHCHAYTEELHGYLGGEAPVEVRFGKMLLDRGGLATFKRANPWLAEVDVLPYTLIYRQRKPIRFRTGMPLRVPHRRP